MSKKKFGFSLLECFKTIFSRKNLGKQAAEEHIKNIRKRRSNQ